MQAKALNALAVHASSNSNIDNLGIVAGVGAQELAQEPAAAVNRINTNTTASLSSSDKQKLVSSDTLSYWQNPTTTLIRSESAEQEAAKQESRHPRPSIWSQTIQLREPII